MMVIVCFIFAGLMAAFVIELGCHNYRSATVLGSLAAVMLAGLAGFSWYSNTSRVYQVHDVKVRIHYLDGSTRDIRLERCSRDIPHIDARHRLPYLVTGRGAIPCVDRFDILEERCYEMTGSELWNKMEE